MTNIFSNSSFHSQWRKRSGKSQPHAHFFCIFLFNARCLFSCCYCNCYCGCWFLLLLIQILRWYRVIFFLLFLPRFSLLPYHLISCRTFFFIFWLCCCSFFCMVFKFTSLKWWCNLSSCGVWFHSWFLCVAIIISE